MVTRYELVEDFPRFDVDSVFLGNGVSGAHHDDSASTPRQRGSGPDPRPRLPAVDCINVAGRRYPIHYLCDETNGWQPDIADLESKITDRTKALVVINPNNPTGAVYSVEVLRQMADLARKHQLLLADGSTTKILYDDAEHISLATIAPDVLCLTFNGLSKAYRVAGYRSGWLVITGTER